MDITTQHCPGCTRLQSSSRCTLLSRLSSFLPGHIFHTVLLVLILQIHESLPAQTPTFTPPDLIRFQDGSTKYYRYLQMDTNSQHLYVGAMDYLYRLDLNDINNAADSVNLPSSDTDVNKCLNRGKSQEFDCKNHIRSIIVMDNTIHVCGTGAFSPREDVLFKRDLSVNVTGNSLSGRGKCPYDPNDNATSVYITEGNPGNMASIYSGTVTDKEKTDPVIFRPDLESTPGLVRTEKDSKWLEEPNFVGSFDAGDFVYFFFREPAIEAVNCGKAVYSRVARVCKNDKGGYGLLENKWTTYLKARLNCSISGEFPLYFHEIYDVKRIGDTFYGIFTTNNVEDIYGSAVCAFTNADISSAFAGAFKEQESSTSWWLPVKASDVPTQRPGQCVENSLDDLQDDVVQFIKERPLMDEAVKHSNEPAGVPLYYKSNIIFNNLAVDTVTIDSETYYVYFLSTDQGQIHKIVQWREGADARTRLLSVWTPFDDVVTIWKMELQNGQLYIATDDAVLQIDVQQCDSYTACADCVHDPYCGWHDWDKNCTPYGSSARNNVKEDSPVMQCHAHACKKGEFQRSVRMPGDPLYLHCDTNCPTDSVMWYHEGSQLYIDNTKYFLIKDQGLVVFNVTTSDSGSYYCKDSSTGVELAKHTIEMPSCGDDTSCLWKEEFRNWCSEFDLYKKQFNNWVCLKDACLDDETCMPKYVSGECSLQP